MTRDSWNAARFDGGRRGHYESWFLRANHPTEPRAFWIRYTIFAPKGRPADAVGELWAIAFDAERGRIVAAKEVVPVTDCEFSPRGLGARVGPARLGETSLGGEARSDAGSLAWQLDFRGGHDPLLLLPQRLYSAPLPKAKALVPRPFARFAGQLTVDDETWTIDDWVGSQNHNWGSKHTDHYAWGQVAGFDDDPSVFLECATARLKLGPLWTPPLSPIVVRLGEEELRLDTIRQSLRASGDLDGLTWRLESERDDLRIAVEISAPREHFVGLRYDNPPGGFKTCLNCKVARCRLTITRGGETREHVTQHRAAFEILTDEPDPAIPVVA